MKTILLAALCLALPAAADAPQTLWIDVGVQFDISPSGIAAAGTFAASGAFTDTGSVLDAAAYSGAEVHVNRVLTGSAGEISLSITGNSVSWENVPPTWCTPPAEPDGTVLVAHNGNWSVASGTGAYATLQGTGAWATWVLIDVATNTPLSAKECLSGRAHFQQ
jgi:hypothetical protein